MPGNVVRMLFDQLLQRMRPTLHDHIVENLITEEQVQLLNLAYYILEENLRSAEKPIVFGGKPSDQHLQAYSKLLIDQIQTNIKHETNAASMKQVVNNFIELIQIQIEKTCGILLPVEGLDLSEIILWTLPHIDWENANSSQLMVKPMGIITGGLLRDIMPHDLILATAQTSAREQREKVGQPAMFFAPITTPLQLPIYAPCAEQNESDKSINHILSKEALKYRDIDFLHVFRQITSKDPCFEEVQHYDVEDYTEGNPFASFLNGDSSLMGVLETFGARQKYNFEEIPYTITGLIHPTKFGTMLMLYNYTLPDFPNILASIKALCQLGASCAEFPRKNANK